MTESVTTSIGAAPETRARLIDAVAFRALGDLATANAGGAALGYLYAFVAAEGIGPGLINVATDGTSAGLLVAIMTVAAIRVGMRARRLFGGARRWVVAGRPPTAEEQTAVLSGPWLLSGVALFYWLVGAVAFALHTLVIIGGEVREAVPVAAVGVGAGLVTSALTYLRLERRFRPLFAIALAARPASDTFLSSPGIRSRLLIAWTLGSGVPLLGIGAALARGIREGTPVTAAIAFLVALGIGVGLWMTLLAARSLADPLEEIRGALRHVGERRLDVAVAVDDGGEIGLLQSGFNMMVQGLAERERLRDLFGRHVGEGVARRALDRGIELGGERTTASVLFVDITDSTALVASREPTAVVSMLNDFFAVVVSAVEEHGGFVNKFEGDGALCVFGVPDMTTDHATRCLAAARSLRDRLAGVGRTHPGLEAGIGVSSGQVVAGNVGASQRFEYTVIGDPVNEAARLVEIAKTQTGRVVASAAAVRGADEVEQSRWTTVGEQTLRGRPDPTRLFVPAD